MTRPYPIAEWPGTRAHCPKCKSTRVAGLSAPDTNFYAREIMVCGNCKTAWEPIEPALIWDESDPLCSFSEPCGNCAFRPGSPEQRDGEGWRKLIANLRAGGQFYCHKGIALDPGGKDGFAYPAAASGAKRTRRMRLCRGFLDALGKWWKADGRIEA